MSASLTVLTGSAAGKRVALSEGEITLGRDPSADLQLDPLEDITVSGSHAVVSRGEDGWIVRDAGSLNGTFLNGDQVSAPVLLRDKDRIQLGPDGPALEFRLSAIAPVEERLEETGNGEVLETAGNQGTERRRGHRHLWTMVVALGLTLIGVTWLALRSQQEGQFYRARVQAMEERIDSILEASATTADALQGRIQGLHDALTESRQTLQTVRTDLETARQDGNSAEVSTLQVQLQEAQAALVRHQLAATLDYEAIEASNRSAVAKVFVDFGDEMVSATAFAVRADATLLTSRHVVAGPSGTRTPVRLVVQFADSRQIWPARVLGTSPSDDLAVLKIDNIIGVVPTIQGLNHRPDTIRSGQGVAIIGFPLGGGTPSGEGDEELARTTLTAGIVGAVGEDLLEVNGYGVEGSSGSPVLDDNGEVVGVLFGGRVEDGERTLFVVPANRAVAFLNQVLPGR